MRRTVPTPQTAPTLAELRGGLGDDQHLAGYDVIIDRLSEALTGRAPTLCVRASRRLGDDLVPSVLAVMDDVICEAWLDGRQVHVAMAERPGPPPGSA